MIYLAFLPGEREIRDVSHFLRQASIDRLDVLPLYARLGAKEQQRIFNPVDRGSQRIVLATNVAETSLTVPGIRYVIDSGLAGSVVILHVAGYSAYLSNPSAKRARISGLVAAAEQSLGSLFVSTKRMTLKHDLSLPMLKF